MTIDYSDLPEHRAIVARDAAIVARERARPSIQTTDAAFYTPNADPLPPQVRATKKASPIANRWRFSDHSSARGTTIRTRDTVLNCPTPAELEEWTRRMATMSGFDGGTQWQGDLEPVGKAVAQVADALRSYARRTKDRARVKDAMYQAMSDIAEFGNDLGNSEMVGGPAGALASGSQDELTREDVHAANNITPSLSKAATGDSGSAHMRRVRDQTGNEVAKINAQNAAYWDKATAWQKR
jgi:hypothetical protein